MAVRALISSRPDAVVGIDAPFGLPAPLVAARTWIEFVRAFAGRYPDADSFKAACVLAAGGRELRRATDLQARTPFCAYNLRLYRQTFHGLNDVLGPLVASGAAAAVPMQRPLTGRPVLVEVCPASTLIAGGVREPYKGAARQAARSRIVDWLVRTTPMAIPAALRTLAIEEPNGDAVDAIIAASAAARAARAPASSEPDHLVEGFVHV